jgi:lactoylglutathione lyase
MFTSPMVNLYTRDITAACGFYRDQLGFVETFRTPRDGVPTHVEFKLEGFMLALSTVEAARSVHGVEASPGSPVLSLVLWTDVVDAQCARLADAGAPVIQPPHETGNNNRNALLRDPDGNLVELVAKRL